MKKRFDEEKERDREGAGRKRYGETEEKTGPGINTFESCQFLL